MQERVDNCVEKCVQTWMQPPMSVCSSERMDHLHEPMHVVLIIGILSWLSEVLTQCDFCAVL